MLISDKVDFNRKTITRNNDDHFTMMKESIYRRKTNSKHLFI